MNTDCQHIIFSDEAYNAVITETNKMHPNETGGILLGHILDNGIWIVMEVLPPGWRSTFEYAFFEYDEQFVNYVAQNESQKYAQELSLLGLWHRHPGSMDTFSSTDDGTNRTFAGLHPKGAISGLVNVDPRFRLTMYHVANPLRYEKVEVEVGNDLIPEEYFKWKYYDGKERNPFLAEKSMTGRIAEKRYEFRTGASRKRESRGISSKIAKLFKRDTRFWFQKNPKLYLKEEEQIRANFHSVEKTVENDGTLSFLFTDTRISNRVGSSSFQLVYAANYGKSKAIKIYLVAPGLKDLLGGNLKGAPCVATDEAGESYLDFSKKISKNKVSGLRMIVELKKWLELLPS